MSKQLLLSLAGILLCVLVIGGLFIEAVKAQNPEEGGSYQPLEQNTPDPPSFELTTVGWLEANSLTPASDVTTLALNPVDCAIMSSPVIAYEISRGQDSNEIADFTNALMANGFSMGTVDIGGNVSPPSCVDVLIVQGATLSGPLSVPYTPADGALLRAWAANGHGLMLLGDWGSFKNGIDALFQTYSYSQQGDTAVSDSSDFDPAGPASPPNAWVIYQMANFANHPILNGVSSLELLASSWLSPTTDAIVTTDGDATPPDASVLAAFTDGSGCIVLATDTNWVGTIGYFKEDNALAAQQAIQWLNSCASLSLTKAATPSPVQAGQILTYTLTTVNNSTFALSNVLITDTIPASTTFVSATLPHNGPDAAGVISWPLGMLGINTSAVVTMTVQVDGTVPDGTLIDNTAWVTSTEGLSDTATVLTLVSNQIINPLVTKAVTPNQAQPGDVVTFTLTVQQVNGNSDATNVQIVDPLPNEVDILGIQATTGISNVVGGSVTWIIPALASTDITTITILARIRDNVSPLPLTIENQAILSYNQGPDRLSNLVQVDVSAPTPTPTSVPTTTPTPVPTTPSSAPPSTDYVDKNDDDDDDDDPPAPPPSATPIALVSTPVATEPLPVTLLPETGVRPTSGLKLPWSVAGLVFLIMTIVLLEFKSRQKPK